MNKKVLITGASRGIGRGIALTMAQAGYDIAFSYASRRDEAEVTAQQVREYGVSCCFFQALLQNHGEGERLIDKAAEALGGLDVLVNNAGMTICEELPDITDENLDLTIDLDFRNTVVMMRHAVKYMIDHDVHGSIINITSSRGERAYPADGIYGGLKAGLNRAIQSFALDVGQYGIRINNVAPGAIRIRKNEEIHTMGLGLPETFWDEMGQRIPLKRAGLPSDIGKAVRFLASDESSYITGITIRVDGGLILPGMPEFVPEGTIPGDWHVVMKSD